MLNLDPGKLLVILVVALIVLGPERLPKIARQLGGAWRELNRLRERFDEEVRAVLPLDELPHLPSPSQVLSQHFSATRPRQTTATNGAGANHGAVGESGTADARRSERAPAMITDASGGFETFLDDPSLN